MQQVGRRLGALGGDPGPGKPIKKLPPFVTDTLFKLIGGPVAINRSYGFSPLGPDNEAITQTPQPGQQGDTAIVFYKEPTDHVYAHEAGHMLDHRQRAPGVLAAADAGRERYNNQLDYFGSSRDEYVAEAFARAVLSGRKGFADSTQVDQRFPGTLDVIRWLRTQAPFNTGQP